MRLESIHAGENPAKSFRIRRNTSHSTDQVTFDIQSEIIGRCVATHLFARLLGNCVKCFFVYASEVIFTNRVQNNLQTKSFFPAVLCKQEPTLAKGYCNQPVIDLDQKNGRGRLDLPKEITIYMFDKEVCPLREYRRVSPGKHGVDSAFFNRYRVSPNGRIGFYDFCLLSK